MDKNTEIKQGEKFFDALFSSMIEDSGNESFQERLLDTEFQKSYSKKIDELKADGKLDDASQMQQLLFELVNSITYGYGNNDIDAIDSEGTRTVEGDRYGRECLYLRQLSNTTTPAVIKTNRALRLLSFCQVGDDNKEGLRIVSKDQSRKVNEKEKKDMILWNEKIVRDAFWNYTTKQSGLATVLPCGYEDVMVLNRLSFILNLNNKEEVIGLIMVDPALIREVRNYRMEDMRLDYKEFQEMINENKPMDLKTVKPNKKDFDYAIYNDLTMRKDPVYMKKEVVIHSKFLHHTDYRTVSTVGSILALASELARMSIDAILYNKGQLNPQTAPKGIINVSGANDTIGEISLQKFKQQLWSYIKNPQAGNRIPVMATPAGSDLKYISLYNNNRDAMFFEWKALINTYICALSGDDPNALGLASNKGVMEGRSLVKEGLDGVQKRSNETGRDTYLRFFESVLNNNDICSRITGNDDWKFEITGLTAEDKQQKIELEKKTFEYKASLNEIRSQNDQEELDIEKYPWADIPGFGNSFIANAYNMSVQQEQAEQQQEQGQDQGGGEDGFDEYDQSTDEDYEDYIDEDQDGEQEEIVEDGDEEVENEAGIYDSFVNDETDEIEKNKPKDKPEKVKKSLIIEVNNE